MCTTAIRSIAAVKGIETVSHLAAVLDLAGGPQRLPAVPPRAFSGVPHLTTFTRTGKTWANMKERATNLSPINA